MNRDVQAYIEDESEFAQIIIVKFGFYFMTLPREVELLANQDVTSQYPEEEDTRYMGQLDLNEQLRQVYSEERKEGQVEFKEFINFTSFLNLCAISISPVPNQYQSSRLLEQIATQFFNDFLIEQIQPRLLNSSKHRLIRSTIQYLIQILDILTSPQLIKVFYCFLFGFSEEDLNAEDEDDQVSEQSGQSFWSREGSNHSFVISQAQNEL